MHIVQLLCVYQKAPRLAVGCAPTDVGYATNGRYGRTAAPRR